MGDELTVLRLRLGRYLPVNPGSAHFADTFMGAASIELTAREMADFSRLNIESG